jgi:hypothetical protein
MSANLDVLTSASTPAAIARTVAEHAFDLAGFLAGADLPEALDREACGVLADCRDRLASLAERIEAAGPT